VIIRREELSDDRLASRPRCPPVGGTGAYVGARGTFTSTNTKTGSNDVVNLLP
jgi:hypothetical protein